MINPQIALPAPAGGPLSADAVPEKRPAAALFIGADELYREGLKRVLARADVTSAGEIGELRPDTIPAAAEPAPDLLVLIDTGAERIDVAGIMAAAGRRWPRARGLLLTRDPAAVDAATLAAPRLAGCLSTSISSEALVLAVRLILLGEAVFAAPAAGGTARAARSAHPGGEPSPGVNLTPRELDITRCLMVGDANKMIAFKLGVSENTVKVILNNVMRKLHVSNRTQVALWARETLSAE